MDKGIINETLGASLDELRDRYVRSAQERAALRKAQQTEALTALADVIRSRPDVIELRVQGWTPSFNDGDICTHNQQVYVDGVNSYGEPVETDKDHDEESAARGKADKKIMAVIDGMTSLLEAAFETNWDLRVFRDGDVIRWTCDEYDCGY